MYKILFVSLVFFLLLFRCTYTMYVRLYQYSSASQTFCPSSIGSPPNQVMGRGACWPQVAYPRLRLHAQHEEVAGPDGAQTGCNFGRWRSPLQLRSSRFNTDMLFVWWRGKERGGQQHNDEFKGRPAGVRFPTVLLVC